VAINSRSTMQDVLDVEEMKKDKQVIVADEEIVIESEFPEWHLENEKDGVMYLIDFSTTTRLLFKMGNGKTYYFSLVKVVETDGH